MRKLALTSSYILLLPLLYPWSTGWCCGARRQMQCLLPETNLEAADCEAEAAATSTSV